MTDKPSNTDVERRVNQLKAIELRRQRKDYREIAKTLGIGLGTAYRYVKEHCKELKACATETAEEMRILDLATLDCWLEVLTERIQTGRANPLFDVEKAISAGCKVMERRHKLVGADAPPKPVEPIAPGDDLDTVEAKLQKALEEVREQKGAMH